MKQSDLLDAIVTAFARGQRRRRRAAREAIHRATRPSAAAATCWSPKTTRPIRSWSSALLEQQGHHGRSSRQRHARRSQRSAQAAFDVILMDVQMPEMGGFEATAAIREHEEATGRHMPIVAMTAHAMAGDRERCLAAGMDAYVSKPLRAAELFAAIDAAIDGTPPSQRSALSPDTTVSSVNVSALLSGFGGRSDLVAEVINVFLANAPVMLTRLRHAGAGSDAGELAAAAHAIKGSAGLFSQGEAYEHARALEKRARSGDASNAAAACDEIDASLSRLVSELRASATRCSGRNGR